MGSEPRGLAFTTWADPASGATLDPDLKLSEPHPAGGPEMSPGDSPGIVQAGGDGKGGWEGEGGGRGGWGGGGSAQLGKEGEAGLASRDLPALAAQ